MKANIEARDVRDCTSLLWSSMEGHLDITKYLVGMKANFEAEDSNSGRTPLIWGAANGHLDIVKYLVGEGKYEGYGYTLRPSPMPYRSIHTPPSFPFYRTCQTNLLLEYLLPVYLSCLLLLL
mmetsp:Transcript_21140/g.34087  ORF Transcript_21140/g.34087 Transcript_21140/m.34087 type:complete len:122 (+) Transcript_21140:3-368(+)